MLLVGAGLLGRTLLQLQRVHLGFRPDHVLTFQLSPPTRQYPLDGKAQLFYQELPDKLRAVPGMREAGVSSGVPMGQGTYSRTPMSALGDAAVLVGTAMPIDWRIVSPGFFHLMGVPVLRGRVFTDADGPHAPPILIASQSMARKFWGDADPIGRVIHRVGDGKDLTVVGVVGDVRNNSLDQELPAMYYPSPQRVWPQMDLVVRTEGEPASVLPGVRAAVQSIDPNLPIATVKTMDDWVSANAAQPRLNAVSLGSSRGKILRLVVREGMTVGLIGVGAGVAGAPALGRVLGSLVYGVPVRDPMTFVIVTAVLTLVALLACVLPARRASRVDPLVALRCE